MNFSSEGNFPRIFNIKMLPQTSNTALKLITNSHPRYPCNTKKILSSCDCPEGIYPKFLDQYFWIHTWWTVHRSMSLVGCIREFSPNLGGLFRGFSRWKSASLTTTASLWIRSTLWKFNRYMFRKFSGVNWLTWLLTQLGVWIMWSHDHHCQ